MNRLQKKCFIVATGFHLLLVLIVIIGPAFLSSSSKPVDVPLIDFIPTKTVDALVSNRGAGSPQPPAQTPMPPVPTPPTPEAVPPAPVPQPPEPVKEVVKEIKPAPKDDPAPVPAKVKPKLPDVSTTVVKRKPTADDAAKQRAQADARAADARARSDAIHSIASIGSSLSKATKIELSGGGGTGPAYANFLQVVKKIYDDAWLLPDGVKDDSAIVTVSVTIARDGTVVSSRIIDRSGNGTVDHSVQATIDRIRRVCPLPDEAKEDQRTVTIDFNVKAKLLG